MKGIYVCLLLTFLSICATAQTFTSVNDGNWNDGHTWSNTAPSPGTAGVDYPSTGQDAIVSSNVTIPGTYAATISNLTVSAGFILDIASGGTLNLNAVLTVEDDLLGSNGFLNISGILKANQGSSFVGDSPTSTTVTSTGKYTHNFTTSAGNLLQANWSAGSTCEVVGYTTNTAAPGFLDQSFYHFTWNCPLGAGTFISFAGALTTIGGNLTVSATGGSTRTLRLFDASSNKTLTIGGDLILNGSSRLVLSTTGTGNLVIVSGNFTVNNSSGATHTFATTGSSTINVGGNFLLNPTISGVVVTMASGAAGSSTMNITGNLTLSPSAASTLNLGTNATSSVTINLSGNFSANSFSTLGSTATAGSDLIFAGYSAQTFSNSGATITKINYKINNGAILDLGTSAVIGTGTFTLFAGGTMKVGSPDGLVAASTTLGNVRVSGLHTYTANGNIVYNGTVAQNLGNEWATSGRLNGVAVNLEIANTHPSGVTNNITGNTDLVGVLTLTSGPFNIGNTNTLVISSNFIGNGGTIGGLSTSNLTFSGSGTFTGTLDFVSGSRILQNFTINRAGTIILGTDLTISSTGILSFPSTGNLDFGHVSGQTLTINGDMTRTGSGGLFSGTTFPANLVIAGSGALSSLPFCSSCGTMQLNNVTLSRTSSPTYTWNSAVKVSGLLDLQSGTLAHSSGLVMTSTSTFQRYAGTSITLNSPNASPRFSISYIGDMASGLELPGGGTALFNLTVAGDVSLGKAITVNGDLAINSGTLSANTFDIGIAGDNFLVNGGSFTMSATKTITFSKGGSTALSGSTVNNIQFGNLTINLGTTLSAPNANMYVSGTWDNSGNFTPNSSTVTFNGTTSPQNVDPNGQPFNNVEFAGTGTKLLQGPLDVNGTLTITSALDVGANQSINVAGTWTNNGTFTAAGGTVTFDGVAQSINSSGQPFFNLTLANSGTKTLTSAIDINGALTISNGVTLDVSSTAYAINLAGNWTNNGTFVRRTGTVTFDGTSAILGTTATNFNSLTIAGALTASSGTSNVTGDWLFSSGSFTANGGTIQFNGNTQSITPGGQSFNNVIIAGTNTKTLQANTDINGNLTLNAATFSVGADRTVNLAGNFDASGGGILAAQAGTFIFDGAAQSITSGVGAFFTTQFAGTSTKTLINAFDANGNVTINAAVALAAGSNAINVAGNWDATTGSFTSTGLTTFDGAAQNIRSNGSSFGSVAIAGSGTKTLLDAFDANSNLTVTSTLDVSASNFAMHVGGDWNTGLGTFTARAGTVTLDGLIQNITSGSSPFFHLSMSGSSPNTKTMQDILDINGNLIINNGSTLNVGNDYDIRIAGHWTINGTGALAAGNGKVIFDGGGTSDVAGSGSTTFHGIDVTGTTNLEIETTHSITGTLSLVGAASRFNAIGSSTSGIFTLRSSGDNPAIDARIAALTTPSNFTGDVTVQRFMSKESMPTKSDTRLYRYISSPVSNAAVSQLQSEIPVTGTFTGASSCSGCTSTSQSMFQYNEAIGTMFADGWVDFPNASNAETFQRGVGYTLFVRGNIIPSALWDLRGPIFSGNITSLPVTYDPHGVDATADGFNLVGNPYPAPIDWDVVRLSATNIANAIYINDNATGVFAQYVNGVGSNGGTNNIAMGQGFWVQSTGASPLLPMNESMKSSASPNFFRQAPIQNLLRIVLGNTDQKDETVIRFHDSGTDNFDFDYDAWKLKNEIFNLSSIVGEDKKLAINTLGALGCGRVVKLDVSNIKTGNYNLSLTGFESFTNQVAIKLMDTYTNRTIDVRNNPVYAFNIDSNQEATFGNERFKVIFEYNGSVTQPEITSNDVCQGSDASILIANSQADVYYSIYSNDVLLKEIGSGNGSDLSITIPKDKLALGDNRLVIKAASAVCDQINISKEIVINSDLIPKIASTSGSSSCQEGTVVLNASGADEGSYRWYETKDAVQPLQGEVSSTFTTPVIPKTKTYYVSAVNKLGCEGERVEVVAEVINYDPVIITEPKPGVFVSSYAEGNQWFKDGKILEGQTGQSISATESGLYSVQVKVGKCGSSAERMFAITDINDLSWNAQWNVYPNPVKHELVVETREELKESPVIFELAGKKIGNIKMVKFQEGWVGRYDFTESPKGVYILQITEKGIAKFKRIVKE